MLGESRQNQEMGSLLSPGVASLADEGKSLRPFAHAQMVSVCPSPSPYLHPIPSPSSPKSTSRSQTCHCATLCLCEAKAVQCWSGSGALGPGSCCVSKGHLDQSENPLTPPPEEAFLSDCPMPPRLRSSWLDGSGRVVTPEPDRTFSALLDLMLRFCWSSFLGSNRLCWRFSVTF
uniref:Uncharacterized protein n=1 Tax=Nothobranchius furzeri TaxID=105023 RepID=A0A1A7ZVI6_NOTFU